MRSSRHEGADADAALMRRVAAGDKGAMHVLFSQHQLAVYRFVLQQLRDRRLAEDVTSEIFLDVWRRAGRFEGGGTALTWILSIAREKTSAARPKPERRSDRVINPRETAFHVRDHAAALRTCMKQLPAEHREVIDLVYCQEQSVESVARILGIPRIAARNRLSGARKRLADEVEKSGLARVAV